MAYAHRHTLVKHVKREHQGSSFSSSGRKSNAKSTNSSKDDGAKPDASTTSRGQDSGAVVAPAEAAGPSAAGTGAREIEGGKGSADPPAESVGEAPAPEKSVAARAADQSLELSVERSAVASKGRQSSPRQPSARLQ